MYIFRMKSVQEMAVEFANTIYKQLNKSVTSSMGVDVMWFRAFPDKKNQDVIFQSYTLYGVEDCPLEFRALYADTNYDEAALTYNIMGISYAIPMTLEIDLSTWEDATGNDGTIPQQYDIVYIPMTQKLLEVASMSPIKKIGGQLTGYKLNLSTYKPKRNRVVGENLKESIEENTVNRDSLFGTEIENALKNIVDNHQLDLKNSTPNDKNKKVEASVAEETGIKAVRSVVKYNLVVDGHTVARNYYNMSSGDNVIVTYNTSDNFSIKDYRTFSCWFKLEDYQTKIKNLKDGLILKENGNETYINVKLGNKFKKDDNVIIKRGMIKIPGKVISTNKISVNTDHIKKLNKINPEWYNVPGFAITNDNAVCFLKSDNLEISIKGCSFISIKINGIEKLIQLSKDINTNEWIGLMVTLSKTLQIDLFGSAGGLKVIESISGLKNDLYTNVAYNNPYIPEGKCCITNIRLCTGIYNDTDKKIQEMITYHVKNDSMYIINDDAMTFLNKNFMGDQR